MLNRAGLALLASWGHPSVRADLETSLVCARLVRYMLGQKPAAGGIGQAARICRSGSTDSACLVCRFAVAEGDLITFLNVWKAWEEAGRSRKWSQQNMVNHRTLLRAGDIKAQLQRHLRSEQRLHSAVSPSLRPSSICRDFRQLCILCMSEAKCCSGQSLRSS